MISSFGFLKLVNSPVILPSFGVQTHKWWVYHQLPAFKLIGMMYYNRKSLMILVNDTKYFYYSL